MIEDESPRTRDDRSEALFDEETFVVRAVEQVKALTHPLRQRILKRLALGPHTTKQVAEQLGEKPTRLYHHVTALEKAGLIRLVETRPKRGTTEKYFAAVAKRFAVDPRALSGEGSEMSVRDTGKALVEGVLANTRSELATLVEQASDDTLAQEVLFVHVEIRGDDESLAAARKKVEALVSEIRQTQPQEGEDVETRRLLLGWYPLLGP